jgi:hypothetical protein
VEVREIEGTRALVLRRDFGGSDYLTCLYVYDGELRELFTEEGFEQELASGVSIMPVADLSFELRNGMIKAVVTEPSGETSSLILTPRSGVKGG